VASSQPLGRVEELPHASACVMLNSSMTQQSASTWQKAEPRAQPAAGTGHNGGRAVSAHTEVVGASHA
jgi:hypothetical protein